MTVVVHCSGCDTASRHAFLCRAVPAEGPAWEFVIQAIGPHDARHIAEDRVADEPFDTSITVIRHAPGEELVADIDPWQQHRDAGLAENELRALAGDR